MPRKSITLEYDLHLGELIHEAVKYSRPKITFEKAAEYFGLSGPNAFRHKCNMPHFGTVYDIIKASILLKQNFFAKPIAIVENQGVPFVSYVDQKKYDELDNRYSKMVEENRILYKTLDKLGDSSNK